MSLKDYLRDLIIKLVSYTPYTLATSLTHYKKPFEIDLYTAMDSIRLRSLELVSQEIKLSKIPGAVAELGVYKGDFAKYINMAFPDKKIYLFDTFEGFDEKDVKIDRKMSFSNGKQDFSDTSMELVLGKMQHKQNVIFKKGYFPESAEGVDETFSFVSIDTDLFEPIYKGLHWFSERINKGGYIFVHDFNNVGYPGAREAVIQFSKETNTPYFPLCDGAGSVVISY